MPTSGPVVGIDVGGTKIHAVVVEASSPLEVVAEERFETPTGARPLVAGLLSVIDRLCPSPVAIGLGVAGLVDRHGVLRYGPNLPGIVDVDVATELGRYDVPVVVDNDNTTAAVAELRHGAGAGVDDGLFIGLGTGLGAGAIIGGAVLRGAHGFAGEAGHMTVVPGGVRCVCGKEGCWERYASGAALARFAHELGGAPATVTGDDVVAALERGDQGAQRAVDALVHWTAVGLADLVALLDPALIVLGGGVSEGLGERLSLPVHEALSSMVFGVGHRPPIPVRTAVFGNRAAALGAGILAVSE